MSKEIKEEFYSIHKLNENLIVKSKTSDNYFDAEAEFERINKEYNLTDSDRFIVSSDEDLSEFSEKRNAIDNAILLEDFEEAQRVDKFDYMMMGRLKSDADEFTSSDSFSYMKEDRLWALGVKEHIEEMEKLYNNVKFKPDWLSREDIQNYKEDMCKLKLELEKDNPDFITEENLPFYYEFMNWEEKQEASHIVDELIHERRIHISKNEGISALELEEDGLYHKSLSVAPNFGKIAEQSFFGVKDTLKPIDEYINEIKESVAYKEYAGAKHEVNTDMADRFNPKLELFTDDFKLGNNELYVKYLKNNFGEKVSDLFKDYFVNNLNGDLKAFTPNEDRNTIILESFLANGLKEDEHINNCIDLQILRKQLNNSSLQEERSKVASDYIVKTDLQDVYYDLQLNKDGEYKDYKGDLRTYETEYLNGNLLLTDDEYGKLYEALIKVEYPTYWNEFTEERYYHMLEVMPPINHKHISGTEFFQLQEKQISNITNTFAQKEGKFYESFQKTTVDFNKLAENVKEFHLSNKVEASENQNLTPEQIQEQFLKDNPDLENNFDENLALLEKEARKEKMNNSSTIKL